MRRGWLSPTTGAHAPDVLGGSFCTFAPHAYHTHARPCTYRRVHLARLDGEHLLSIGEKCEVEHAFDYVSAVAVRPPPCPP